METTTAVNGMSPVTLKLEKGANKLLSSLVWSTKPGLKQVNIDYFLSTGMTTMGDWVEELEHESNEHVSTVTLFFTASHVRSGFSGPDKDRHLLTPEAVQAFERINQSWLANRNWFGINNPEVKFYFADDPQSFSKAVAAGALYTSVTGIDDNPELVKLTKNGRNLSEYFPDQEEPCYVYRFFRVIDLETGTISYSVFRDVVIMYWLKDAVNILPRFQVIPDKIGCLLVEGHEPTKDERTVAIEEEVSEYDDIEGFDPADD